MRKFSLIRLNTAKHFQTAGTSSFIPAQQTSSDRAQRSAQSNSGLTAPKRSLIQSPGAKTSPPPNTQSPILRSRPCWPALLSEVYRHDQRKEKTGQQMLLKIAVVKSKLLTWSTECHHAQNFSVPAGDKTPLHDCFPSSAENTAT